MDDEFSAAELAHLDQTIAECTETLTVIAREIADLLDAGSDPVAVMSGVAIEASQESATILSGVCAVALVNWARHLQKTRGQT